MRSDIDDLLNEIDSALTPGDRQRPAPAPARTQVEKSAIDDLISEVADIGSDSQVSHPVSYQPVSYQPVAPAVRSKRTEKCYFLCISGTQTPIGVSYSGMDPKVCSSLRCTGCDHTVISFPDSVWTDDCEYYFFRNNYQRPTRLREVATN